jgi:hypothetical protein
MKTGMSQILVTVCALETITVPEEIICGQICAINLLTTTMTLLCEEIFVTPVTVTVAVPY